MDLIYRPVWTGILIRWEHMKASDTNHPKSPSPQAAQSVCGVSQYEQNFCCSTNLCMHFCEQISKPWQKTQVLPEHQRSVSRFLSPHINCFSVVSWPFGMYNVSQSSVTFLIWKLQVQIVESVSEANSAVSFESHNYLIVFYPIAKSIWLILQ